ncbi:[weak similarity to] transcriptional regulator [methanotrophic bacterial endosymbiont of Bathymodiolus sp.]|nr:[weak similarity to] transcriptional regulator [methanotrophic bacterial endosymbiont of Bathymodiolus sp.]
MSDNLKKEVFFRKLGKLDEGDQEKIMDMIDTWGKKK